MFGEYIGLIVTEGVAPTLAGYFLVAAHSARVRRWAFSGWVWLLVAIGAFSLVARLELGFWAGLLAPIGFFAIAASGLTSASAARTWKREQNPSEDY